MSAGEIMMSMSNKAANNGELSSQKSMTSTDMQRHRFLVPIKALDELFPGYGKQKPPLIFKEYSSAAATTFERVFETKHEQGHLYLKGKQWKNFESENNITVGGVVKFTKDPNVENQILVSYISPDPSAETLVGSGGGVSRDNGCILPQNQMASKDSSDLYMAPSNNAVDIESRSIGVVTESLRADHHDYHDSLEHPSLVSLHSQGKVAGYGYDGADKNATNSAIDLFFPEDGVRLNPNALSPLFDNFGVVHQLWSPSPNALEQNLPSSQTPKGSISDNAYIASKVRGSVADNISALDEDRERLLPYFKQYIVMEQELPAKLESLDSSSRDNVILLVGSIMEILSSTRVEDITPQQRSEINKCWDKIRKYTDNILELPKLSVLVALSQKLTQYEINIKKLDRLESKKRKVGEEIDKCNDSLKHLSKDERWIETLGTSCCL